MREKLTWKLYEFFKVLQFQKRIVAAAIIQGGVKHSSPANLDQSLAKSLTQLMISNSSLIHTFFSIGIPTLLRPEDILNVSIQSQEAILSSSANNDPTEDDLNPGFESSICYDHNKCRLQDYIGLLFTKSQH